MKSTVVALCASVILTGCASLAPVTAKFPVAPATMLQPCPPLKSADTANTSIVELLKVIVDNYTTHYECSLRHEAWIEWYRKQREIHDAAAK